MTTTLQLFDPAQGTAIVRAPASAQGHWAGAPGRASWRGMQLLTYRLRAPRPRRGYEVRVAELRGDRVTDLCAIDARAMTTASLERAALLVMEEELALYVSYVDPEDGRWRIDLLRSPSPAAFDARERAPVLDAAMTGSEGVKDPVVVRDGSQLRMYVSVAVRDGAADHSTSDAFATGTVLSVTGLASSRDGRSWLWEGVVLRPTARSWDAYEARISCLLGADLALYDGIARPEHNYRERTGIARRDRSGRWRSITPDAPVIAARYVTFDGGRFFWEHELPDGSHELRAAYPGGLAVQLA